MYTVYMLDRVELVPLNLRSVALSNRFNFKEFVMSTFFKTLAALAFLCGVQAASAACYPNSGLIPAGSPPVILTNGMWCTQNSGGHVGGQNIIVAQPQPYYGSSAPFGSTQGSSSFCAGLVERGGRYLGARDGNDAKHTEGGGLLGFLAGNVFCPMMSNQGQRVAVPQGHQHENVGYGHQGGVQSSTRGVFCNIDGVVTKEADTPTCEAKARQKAEGLVTGKASQVMSQGHAPVCGTGKTWGRLNWQGHPQHNTFACLPGDAPRFQE